MTTTEFSRSVWEGSISRLSELRTGYAIRKTRLVCLKKRQSSREPVFERDDIPTQNRQQLQISATEEACSDPMTTQRNTYEEARTQRKSSPILLPPPHKSPVFL